MSSQAANCHPVKIRRKSGSLNNHCIYFDNEIMDQIVLLIIWYINGIIYRSYCIYK